MHLSVNLQLEWGIQTQQPFPQIGDGNGSNVFRGDSTVDEGLWRSANDGSVQGFAGRALPSPVNQDGQLNEQ